MSGINNDIDPYAEPIAQAANPEPQVGETWYFEYGGITDTGEIKATDGQKYVVAHDGFVVNRETLTTMERSNFIAEVGVPFVPKVSIPEDGLWVVPASLTLLAVLIPSAITAWFLIGKRK